MAHSGKTMTFATDLVPQEDNIYNLGQENLKWIIRGSLPLSDVTGADDLKAIEAISGTTGLLKKTAANTWTLDTNSYVTSSGITSVTIGATSPVQSSTSTAQNGSSASTTISLKDAYGDTKNPYGSKTKNYVLAAPSNANGAPSFRALVATDIPDLSWNKITSDKPTTLSGYGITNAVQYNGIDNDIGSSATAANAKAYWANNNKVPKGKVVFNYNTAGTEFTTLFSNNNNSYGSILRWGYQDNYIRILRAHPNQTTYNGWYTEDWEKISAGYADTAPWSGISNKPTTLTGYGITDAIKTVTSTDNAIVRFNGTSGQIQNSGAIIDDSNNIFTTGLLQTGRYFHNVATYSTSGTPKEILIKTKIPFTSGSTMPKIYFHMDNYGAGKPTELSLVFYIYNNAFCNMGATSNTSHRPIITLSTYTESNQKYVAIGLGLIDNQVLPDAYFIHFNIDFLDIWPNNNRTSHAMGWVIEANTSDTSIIPTTDRQVISYIDQSQSALKAGIASTKYGIAYYSDATGTFAGTGAGTSGQYLKSNGSSAPTWATFSASTVGLGNVENTKLSTWAGSANITTVGTISTGTWHGTKIANDYIANPKVTIAGNEVSLGGSLSDSTLRESLGLSKALRFIGVTTTDMTGGTATNHSWTGTPAGISNYTPKQGDVVINSTKQDEWVCTSVSGTTYAWERLGSDTSYKIVQSAVSDPTASTTTSTTFIDTISQNANGVITATKKTLPTASSTVAGITKVGASGGAAAYNHTHTISLTQTGTSTINLAANTVYTLTAGGNSVVFKTPADQNTDTKVTQAYSTTDAAYPILMTATAGNTSTASRGDTTAILNNSIYANPSTGQLNATSYKVNEAITLQYNPGDSSLEFIFA